MGRALAILAFVGCGRVSFDPRVDASVVGPTGLALRVSGGGYATFDSVCASMTGPISITGWVNPNVVQADPASCMYGLNSASGGANYALVMWNQATSNPGYFDDFFTNRVDTAATVPAGQWQYIAIAIDATGIGTVYLNGEISVTFDTSRTVTAPCLFSLGQEWDGTTASDFFAGYFDEVAIWEVAKTQADVQMLMTAKPAAGDAGLVAYYTFDAGDPRDDSGNQHTGMLAGNASIVAPP